MATCYAPVFKPSTAFSCALQSFLAAVLLLLLILAWVLSFGNPAMLCEIRRVIFRTKYCRQGNDDPDLDVLADAYTMRVRKFKALYNKDGAWEQWMEDNRDRYLPVFNAATAAPRPITLAFRYYAVPIAYNPAWVSEAEHMAALKIFMELAYAGYDFQLLFNANPATTYASIVAGIPTNASYASGRTIQLYYETIINHEFGHVMWLAHHYDSLETVGNGLHMPPGETGCIMDRTTSEFCSACRTALGVPLNANNAGAIATAADVILDRYPY